MADLPQIHRDEKLAPRLVGQRLPEVSLSATDGTLIDLSRLDGTNVIYCYPRTSPQDGSSIPGWGEISGAKGCTPQSCAYRDQFLELRKAGVHRVIGVSTQDTEYQQELRTRLKLPFHILSDTQLILANSLNLPTFEIEGLVLLRRLTLIVRDFVITDVIYPIVEPKENATAVLALLQETKE